MQYVQLGQSDLKVSRLGLGTMGMSEFYGQADEADSLATLHLALEKGVNFWDTADMYGAGHNEELLSKVLSSHRAEVVLATKFGIVRQGQEFLGINGRPEYVRAACEASLRRLRTEVIDLYYQHRLDFNTPIEETVGAMADLVKEGKVRYLGLSEASGETLRRAQAVHPIVAVQSEYSLWSTDIETALMPTLRELKASLVAYSPLGRGFLTGQITRFEDLGEDDYRRQSPRFQGENFAKNLEMVQEVKQLAQDKQCTAAQLALAWVLAKGQDIVPIPGTKRPAYLSENLQALEVQLHADEIQHLDTLVAMVAGTRYPEASMRLTNA
ncbi:MAG: aldo/keto reductase [Microscillaceae bacterium]|nr:aldo/keto reductase [Microscillaceae bacterium]